MTKSRLIAIFSVLLLVVVVLPFLNNKTQKTSSNTKVATVIINQQEIYTEIADTESLREHGFSGRNKIESDHGMLFIFDKKDVLPIFWMKDMLIPIDIIWINDGKITKIDSNVPPPESTSIQDSRLTKYFSPGLTDYVLEVNSGYSSQNGIKVGDSVQITY